MNRSPAQPAAKNDAGQFPGVLLELLASIKPFIFPALLPALLFAAVAAINWTPTFDDAYISQRYAVNWAQGNGLVFNPGERVEGFSDPLWVALMALAARAGFQDVTAAKMIGAASAAAVIAMLAMARSPGDGKYRAGMYAAVLLAASGEYAYFATAGLETAFFSLLLLSLGLVWRPDAGPRRRWAIALLGLLAALTRPEGVLFTALALGALILFQFKRPRNWVLQAVSISTAAGLLLLARWNYYGAWLPNTFLAKPFVASRAYALSSLNFVHGAFLTDYRYFVLAAAAVAFLVYWKRPLMWKLASIFGAGLFFMLWSGGHPRFFSPYLPVFYLMAGSALAALASRGRPWKWAVHLAFSLLVLLTLNSAVDRATYLYAGGRDPSGHSFQHVEVGLWLNQNTEPGDAVIAWEIGAIGLYSERRILDTQGLVDREVATIFKENNVNPYIYWISPRKIRALDAQIIRLLLDREPEYALLEYRGDIDAPVSPDAFIPRDAYVAVVEERNFVLVERFVLDEVIPKSFLLYRSPGENSNGN